MKNFNKHFLRFEPHQLIVVLGSNKLDDNPNPDSEWRREYAVSKVYQHPKFERHGFLNDVGIIELSHTVQFSDYIRPVCLPEVGKNTQELAGYVATVLGWGSTFYGGSGSNMLREVSFPLWSNDECDQKYAQHIGSGFLCAGYMSGGKDACQGDSGSPLMLPDANRVWTIHGIVSFGNRCAQPGYPGVYTRVAEYINWIHKSL